MGKAPRVERRLVVRARLGELISHLPSPKMELEDYETRLLTLFPPTRCCVVGPGGHVCCEQGLPDDKGYRVCHIHRGLPRVVSASPSVDPAVSDEADALNALLGGD